MTLLLDYRPAATVQRVDEEVTVPETLAARRLLVAGASAGVGAAIVRRAGGEIAPVPASARRAGPLADLDEIIRARGHRPGRRTGETC